MKAVQLRNALNFVDAQSEIVIRNGVTEQNFDFVVENGRAYIDPMVPSDRDGEVHLNQWRWYEAEVTIRPDINDNPFYEVVFTSRHYVTTGEIAVERTLDEVREAGHVYCQATDETSVRELNEEEVKDHNRRIGNDST